MRTIVASISKTALLAALLLVELCQHAFAGPPAPPTVNAVPAVPVGGAGVTVATTVAIALYGIWKSRR